MIGSTRKVSVFAYGSPADMRKQYDSLAELVRLEFGQSVLSGDLFLFVGKDRKRAKVLHWDGTGLCIYSKRLEKGHFPAPWKQPATVPLRLTVTELELFLQGSERNIWVPLSPQPFTLPPINEMTTA
jgi:transposase